MTDLDEDCECYPFALSRKAVLHIYKNGNRKFKKLIKKKSKKQLAKEGWILVNEVYVPTQKDIEEFINLVIGFCVNARETWNDWEEHQEIGVLFSKAKAISKRIRGNV